MLGWEGKDEQQISPVDSGKGNAMGLQVLNEGEETTTWDKRQSKAMETPKSVKSLYDQQGFWQSPSWAASEDLTEVVWVLVRSIVGL
ncbi:hypothetical protein D6D17_05666 [Aureobasidium pullulans]|nr:hypothetical protein D6D17_05666 [Aureobasidium pullulans]